jgi:Flp pilus assembly protein TadB
VIERLVIALIIAMVALWVVGWLLVHLGLIFVAGLGFAAWAWWRNRQRA